MPVSRWQLASWTRRRTSAQVASFGRDSEPTEGGEGLVVDEPRYDQSASGGKHSGQRGAVVSTSEEKRDRPGVTHSRRHRGRDRAVEDEAEHGGRGEGVWRGYPGPGRRDKGGHTSRGRSRERDPAP